MLAEIVAGAGSLKTAFDLAQGLNAANTKVAINEAKIALQQHIIEGQSALAMAGQAEAAASQRIRELEQKLMEMENWERQAERYELKQFEAGAFAYSLKPDKAEGEPPHRICPHCFQEKHKAILQTVAQHSGGEMVTCLRCKNQITLSAFRSQAIDHDRSPGYF